MKITQIHDLIRTGKTSSLKITQSYLDRIEQYNKTLMAYCNVTRVRALNEAKSADKAMRACRHLGPLHGVTFAVKDHFDVAEEPTTAGCSLLNDNVARRDAAAVSNLTVSGMVLLGKLHTVQFGGGITGLNHDKGTPHNPWKQAHYVPGGSSSGSGVAVAAGLVQAALGGDTGGSIRVPASLCGIVGLKTTKGLLSTNGVYPMSHTLDTIGPMTRYVEDAALVCQALAIPESLDLLTTLHQGVKNLTLGYAGGLLRKDIDPQVCKKLEDTRSIFEKLGAKIVDVEITEFDEVQQMQERFMINATETYSGLEHIFEQYADQLDPVIGWIKVGRDIRAKDYFKVLRWQEDLVKRVTVSLEKIDGLITATTLIPAPPLAVIDPTGSGIEDYSDGPCEQLTRNASIGNMLGLCAISVPCGFTDQGLPVGMQIYGKPFCESMILRIAQAYETQTEWTRRQPDLSWI